MSENQETITCTFTTEASLYMAYMPFVTGGGLFIRHMKAPTMGTMVKLHVQLLTEPEPYLIDAKVVWLTPKGAQGNKPAGFGVQFTGENSRYLFNKIETYLAGMLKSNQLTDTL